ncbi:MAG: hypothetical protein HFH68_16125 [Lachnospiraceae bacterium]|nr:hypothetical protein [Lachnospiraceae bacterium]
MTGAVNGMPGIMYSNTNEEDTLWEVTCHYDNNYNNRTEPASFMECVALFVLEKQQGWNSDFRPACPAGMETRNGGML